MLEYFIDSNIQTVGNSTFSSYVIVFFSCVTFRSTEDLSSPQRKRHRTDLSFTFEIDYFSALVGLFGLLEFTFLFMQVKLLAFK